MIWEDLNDNIVFTNLKADNYEDVMKNVGGALINEGYAKESYVDALIAREKEFPTGIDVDGFGVAIPHTNSEHINRAVIAIATLEKPVEFIQIGTDDETSQVDIIFMLAVVDPNKHLENLQKIIEVIQDTAVLTALKNAKNKKDIINIIKQKELSL